MKKTISALGALALLGSSAAMAASVEVRPNDTCVDAGGPPATCDAVVNPGDSFFVTLHGIAFPGDGTATGTTGSTLTITYDNSVVSLISATLAPGTPFDFITPPTVQNPSTVIISVLRNATGYAHGDFDAYRINFQVLGSAAGGATANINVFDDGVDNSWTDQDAGAIAVTYSQADVGVVPLPATAWLIAPAILAAGRFSRRRKAA